MNILIDTFNPYLYLNLYLALLSLLILSAAFDTLDHDILRQRLTRSFGIRATSLEWLYYLMDRTLSIYLDGQSTTPRNILCSILQGSVFEPLLFTLYTADIGCIIQALNLHTSLLHGRYATVLLLHTGKCVFQVMGHCMY